MEKIEAQTSQMDGNLKASNDARDCEFVDTDVEKDLLQDDLTVESLAEKLKAAAGSTENNPEENSGSNQEEKAGSEGEIQNTDQAANIEMGSRESIAEANVNGKRKRRRRRRGCRIRDECPSKEIEISGGKDSSLSVLLHDDVEGTSHLPFPSVNEAECLSKDLGYYTRITPIPSVRRKLIVLDVNGLLANIVMPAPKDYRADGHILGRAIFKRPFCDDFLKFCFQNFAVGVWSSRSKRIIERVVDYLLGDQKGKLLFCWDMAHSTQTGFNTLENVYKPLVFKELRKIWENDDPSLPWKNGEYNESNTLLLDDSPYKALLNPLHTAIFPNSYQYKDSNDNSLGPGGDLRVYLEGLLQSEDVQKYVEQHPFGQSSINETNLSWAFYSDVLQNMPKELQDTHTDTPSSQPTLT